MRKFIFGLMAFLLLLLVAIIVIPFLIPASTYKTTIETQLSKELGRQVTIEGDISVSPFPVLKAKAGRVSIDNADGFENDLFAAMNAMDTRIKLRPLLSKRVEIASFTLVDPEIYLEVRVDGQNNWSFGDQGAQAPDPGPFKRDGRLSDLDPSIGKFTLENGKISYANSLNGKNHRIDSANLDFELPNLDEIISIDGDLVLNGLAMDVGLSLDTPRSFLNGQKTPVVIETTTVFGFFKANGYFTESQDFEFVLDVQSSLKDLLPLSEYLPKNLPITGVVKSLDLSGTYSFDGQKISATGADVHIKGPELDTRFVGDAVLDETPVLDGALDLSIQNMPKLAKAFGQKNPALQMIDSAVVKADLKAGTNGFSSDNLKATIIGNGLNADFDGKASYNGALSAQGAFSSDIQSVSEIASTFGVTSPQIAALGQLTSNGTFTASGKDMVLDLANAETKSAELNAKYQGTVKLSGPDIELNGNFESTIPSVSNLAAKTQTPIAYSSTIETVTAKGAVSGKPGKLSLTGMNIQLSEGQINGTYTGDAKYGEVLNLSGHLDAEIPSARRLAAGTGTQLPASTDAGQIYERVAINGKIEGTPSQITFSEAGLALDQIAGTGAFALDMTGTKPNLKGTLDMGQIDLRPYMSAYMAQYKGQGVQPWSTVPYNFAAIRAMDGNYTIKTPEILFGALKLGQTDVDTSVTNGVLVAKLPDVNLYGGLGVMTATLDASGEIPKVKLDMKLEDITSNSFLASIANFTKLEGDGHTVLAISGEGRTQDEIMKSLSGYGNFEVLDGVISGIDLSRFLGGFDQALTSRVIPDGLGKDFKTPFRDVIGSFSIKNGVVSVNEFNLKASDALAAGSGKLDLGNQSLDFSLRPRLTGSNSGDLGKFGIPLRLKGDWGAIAAGLDTDLLMNIATAKAKTEITNQVGGVLGNVFGNVLGIPQEETPTQNPAEQPAETPSEAPEETTIDETSQSEPTPESVSNTPEENSIESPLGSILGEILGQPTPEPTEAPQTEPTSEPGSTEETIDGTASEHAEQTPEPEEPKDPTEELVDDVLGNLFGKNKDKEAEPEE